MAVFIQKGDAPLSVRQAEKRGKAILDREMKPYEREAASALNSSAYEGWVIGWLIDNEMNAVNNLFNHQLAAYRAATARLARYRLADGREELTEMQPGEETDPETGEPVLIGVVVRAAIEPLDATVDGWDNSDPENPVEAQIANPMIVADDAERAEADVVIAGTPAEVIEFTL